MSQSPHPRVLLIDEDAASSKALTTSLEGAQFVVAAASTLAEARTLLADGRPDLILTDLRLPDGRSADLALQLREDPRTATIPLVALTGLDSPMSPLDRADRFAAVLLKSVEPAVLVPTLLECLGEDPVPADDSGIQLLVVDDEPLTLRLMAGHLRHAGYAVRTASSGAEAIAIARRWSPALLVTDLAMPRMPGDVLARRIRRLPGLDGLRVVMVTAGVEEQLAAENLKSAGFSRIVPKDVDPSALLDSVAEALRDAGDDEDASHAFGGNAEIELLLRRLERQSRMVGILEEAIALQEAELRVISGVADAVQGARSPGELISTTLQHSCDLSFVETGVAWLFDDDGDLKLHGVAGRQVAALEDLQAEPERATILREFARNGMLRILPSPAGRDERVPALLERLGGFRSAIVIPLRRGVESAGVVVLGSSGVDLGAQAWAFGQTIQSQLSQSLTLRASVDGIAATARSFKEIAESLADALLTADRDGVVVFANATALRLWSPVSPVGRPLQDYLTTAEGGPPKLGEFEGLLQNDRGRSRQVHVHGAPLPGAGPLGVRAYTLRDITATRRHQAWLERLATEDALTGLPNRRAFEEELGSASKRGSRRSDRLLGVLFFDLDGFKAVNDTQGHDAGDALLAGVAGRIRERLRNEEFLARIGGDEFAILVRDTSEDELRFLGDLICALVREEARLQGPDVTASVGIASARPGDRLPTDLVDDADQAMYEAKRAGGDRYAEAPATAPPCGTS